MHKFTTVFKKTIKAWNEYPAFNLIGSKGGQGSSKTISNLQLFWLKAARSDKPLLMTAMSHSVPHLKKGIIRDMKDIHDAEGGDWESEFNKTDSIIKVGKSIIEFTSADKMKAHGPRRDHLFVNEANAIKYEVFRQQFNRTNGMCIVDFNHLGEFWYDTELPKEPGIYKLREIISTYLDNEYIPDKERHVLENAIPGTYFHDVYVLGKMGKAEGVIFDSWIEGEMDDRLPFCYGMDFGVVDEDAICKVAVDERANTIYLEEKYYKAGNKTKPLIADVLALREKDKDLLRANSKYAWAVGDFNPPFICDTSAKRSKLDLQDAGVNIPYFAKPEVIWSIRQMQNYTIVVCGNSPNLRRELNNYKWLDDKNIPIDKFNHLLDAARYGFTFITSGQQSGNLYD